MTKNISDDPVLVKVTAILTSHNRQDLTVRCLTSYFAQETPGWAINAVLVDDGSTDGTAKRVRELFPDVEVVEADGTLFWAAGMAAAERIATQGDPDYILWLNDDVVLLPQALAVLITASREQTKPHILSGAVVSAITLDVTYGGVRRRDRHPMRFDLVPPIASVQRVDTVHGNLLLVPKRAYVQLGGIDGEFAHAFADFDYGLRMWEIGGECLLAPSWLGECEANDWHSIAPMQVSLLSKWQHLNDRKRSPIRSQVRYLRRHGGVAWPVFVVTPYLRVLREHLLLQIKRKTREPGT